MPPWPSKMLYMPFRPAPFASGNSSTAIRSWFSSRTVPCRGGRRGGPKRGWSRSVSRPAVRGHRRERSPGDREEPRRRAGSSPRARPQLTRTEAEPIATTRGPAATAGSGTALRAGVRAPRPAPARLPARESRCILADDGGTALFSSPPLVTAGEILSLAPARHRHPRYPDNNERNGKPREPNHPLLLLPSPLAPPFLSPLCSPLRRRHRSRRSRSRSYDPRTRRKVVISCRCRRAFWAFSVARLPSKST